MKSYIHHLLYNISKTNLQKKIITNLLTIFIIILSYEKVIKNIKKNIQQKTKKINKQILKWMKNLEFFFLFQITASKLKTPY